jgi:DNA-binding response OmpR family regulator
MKPFALIIEDDPKLGKIFEATLQRAGFDTALDPEGDGYDDFLDRENPSMVIMDMHLPFGSGQEILTQLRSLPRWAKVPVIIVTADLFMAKALESKGEHVLLKPFTVTRLAELVAVLAPTHP